LGLDRNAFTPRRSHPNSLWYRPNEHDEVGVLRFAAFRVSILHASLPPEVRQKFSKIFLALKKAARQQLVTGRLQILENASGAAIFHPRKTPRIGTNNYKARKIGHRPGGEKPAIPQENPNVTVLARRQAKRTLAAWFQSAPWLRATTGVQKSSHTSDHFYRHRFRSPS